MVRVSKTVEPVIGHWSILPIWSVNTKRIKQANKHVLMALTYNLKKYLSLSPKKTKQSRVVNWNTKKYQLSKTDFIDLNTTF
jgi:hypothetical protein